MSQALTLARPYARAAFATARDEGTFAPWSDALAFSAHVAADPRVAALLANPELGRDDARSLPTPRKIEKIETLDNTIINMIERSAFRTLASRLWRASPRARYPGTGHSTPDFCDSLC